MYLHSCRPQIIHRDLKLDNILLSGAGQACAASACSDRPLSMWSWVRLSSPAL